MFRVSALPALVLIVISVFGYRAEAMSSPASNFAPGQEWSIRSASPTTAKVVICRVDEWKGKTAVHVSIIDIPVPKGMAGAGSLIRIGHVAFEKAALEASVDRLIATGVSSAPSFETGYQQWKNEQGALSKMSVSNTIAFGLAAMSRMK